jgi:hypothetical protein
MENDLEDLASAHQSEESKESRSESHGHYSAACLYRRYASVSSQ